MSLADQRAQYMPGPASEIHSLNTYSRNADWRVSYLHTVPCMDIGNNTTGITRTRLSTLYMRSPNKTTGTCYNYESFKDCILSFNYDHVLLLIIFCCLFTCLFMFNSNWVDTRWQQYSTHLHTNSTQNTEDGTYITIKKKLGSARRALSLRVIPWHLPYN
jgi:hypothetical protein